MKSSLREIARLENEKADPALIERVRKAYIRKQARKAARKSKGHNIPQAEIQLYFSVSEGDALPANMDLDGSLLEDENQDYVEMAQAAQAREEAELDEDSSTHIGQIFNLQKFSFTNTKGGTGQSNWEFNPKFEGIASVRVIKDWEDYECGHRFIGEAINQELIDYLQENGHPTDHRVFFSEFEIQKLNAHARLRAQKNKAIQDHKGSAKTALGRHMAAFKHGDIPEVDPVELF